ncbi:hypothetical protein [Gordonia liuliyuniae]|uniref:Uncharacterized protein n=1 Tax=Gordonia liuliyuniae TaxID=2911517 RepID=A0ABS9IW24_9ACTN|nr:hypothetical protein [Gordonia liuliyuniae]MCF8589761.1 hypothetical protein [Gordonia liuliyuniae]
MVTAPLWHGLHLAGSGPDAGVVALVWKFLVIMGGITASVTAGSSYQRVWRQD